MVSLADFTTAWRNHSHSNFALFRSPMTDEEEFSARSQLKWDAGRRRMDIALSPPANGPRGPRQEPPRHVAINQSGRYPIARQLPASSGRTTSLPGRWRWCDHPWLCDARESKTHNILSVQWFTFQSTSTHNVHAPATTLNLSF